MWRSYADFVWLPGFIGISDLDNLTRSYPNALLKFLTPRRTQYNSNGRLIRLPSSLYLSMSSHKSWIIDSDMGLILTWSFSFRSIDWLDLLFKISCPSLTGCKQILSFGMQNDQPLSQWWYFWRRSANWFLIDSTLISFIPHSKILHFSENCSLFQRAMQVKQESVALPKSLGALNFNHL